MTMVVWVTICSLVYLAVAFLHWRGSCFFLTSNLLNRDASTDVFRYHQPFSELSMSTSFVFICQSIKAHMNIVLIEYSHSQISKFCWDLLFPRVFLSQGEVDFVYMFDLSINNFKFAAFKNQKSLSRIFTRLFEKARYYLKLLYNISTNNLALLNDSMTV